MPFKKTMLVLLGATLLAALSCAGAQSETRNTVAMATTSSAAYSVDDSIVQVWQPAGSGEQTAELLAFGVAVGDSSHVLTVLDYESFTPEPLEVISPKYGTFNASIQAIDSRTSATLLELNGGELPPAKIAEAAGIRSTQDVIVRGWLGADSHYGTIKGSASALNLQTQLFFRISEDWEGNGLIGDSGAVITDGNGRVLGLLGSWYSSLVIRLGPVGMLPLAVSINGALDLLAEDASSKPWANGPLQMLTNCLTLKNGNDYWLSPLSDIEYDGLVSIIHGLLSDVGQPLSAVDPSIVSDYYWLKSEDGKFLTTVFAHPVSLRDAQGDVLANAKWVRLQWDRSDGKPNRIMYGITPYVVAGVFEADESTANLARYFPMVLRKDLLS